MKNILLLIALLHASLAGAQSMDVPQEIKAKYDTVNYMINNTIVVKSGKKWGIVNESDKIIVPFKYDLIKDIIDSDVMWYERSYSNEIVTVKLKNRWGVTKYIDILIVFSMLN